jgi:alpha-ribazole phosphatase
VIDRVAGALHDLRASQAREAVWVTHAGVIRAVQFVAAHGAVDIASVDQWPRDAPAPGGHLCIDW